jgi:hypothetical protein
MGIRNQMLHSNHRAGLQRTSKRWMDREVSQPHSGPELPMTTKAIAPLRQRMIEPAPA